MLTTRLVLVTIVAEEVLEHRLARDLQAAGATGFTVTTARGSGSRGVRTGEGGSANVRIEAVVRPEVADTVFTVLAERYFPHYAVIAWAGEVTVLRGEKFV